MPNPDPSSSVQSPARIALSNILYLTDFSEAAEAAFPFATALTRQYGGKLHVLHILTRDAYAVTTPDLAAEVEAGQKQYADSQMRKMAARMQGLPHETKVEAGVAFWQGLERELKRTHIDLIVVGTHGRQGIRKMLLGSTAEEVFRGAKVPVLTIGPGCGGAKEEGGFSCVLYATDFTPASVGGAPYAFSLAEENQARLILLHVVRHLRKEEMLGELSVADGIHQLNQMIPADANLWCKPDSIVTYGVPAEKILEIAQEQGADLIVLGVHHTGHAVMTAHLVETTAHQVVSQAACPVLTVRA